jgi:hypothetical protein
MAEIDDTANRPIFPSPFHDGERRVQERLGERDVELWARGAIREAMPDQHRAFFEAQMFMVASARDADGRPWATVLEGWPGFVCSPDARSLTVSAQPVDGDALEGAFSEGADVGFIGIELATRRRNRVNGKVSRAGTEGFGFSVGQSFGNCPQYIRARDVRWSTEQAAARVVRSAVLSPSQQQWVRSADTFFIATGYRGEGDDPAYGMDVSHRGGERGFVEVLDDRTLRFPDYAGNQFYNTLGNILGDPRTGLLFLDFSTGSLLQMTGRATIIWDKAEAAKVPGARQLVSFEIESIVELTSALHLRWQKDADAIRSLRLASRHRESADVTSLVFEARDGGALAPFRAGQHLPLELHLPAGLGKVQRSYSLSGDPSDGRYRISVKREPQGLVSRILHDVFQVGGFLDAGRPSGDFALPDTKSPLVMVSAGIGITPVLSMLHQLVGEEGDRPVWFVHSARDGDHHAFREEVRALVKGKANIQIVTHYTRPLPSDSPGHDFDHAGRISAAGLVALSGSADTQYLLCGPAAFLAELEEGLEREGVPQEQIRFESF